MEEKDTRGWKPPVDEAAANKDFIPGSRSGTNPTPRRLAEVNYPQGLERIAERPAELDNMGNSHANEGSPRPHFLEALNVDVAPSVPLSGFDGIEGVSDAGGVKLSMDAGTQPDLHPRELRDVYGAEKAPRSSSVIDGEIGSRSPAWRKATIPMGEKHSAQFESQGSLEGVDEDTGVQSKKGDYEEGRRKIKKGGKPQS